MTQTIQLSQSTPSTVCIEPIHELKTQILAEALQQVRECSQLAYQYSRSALVVSAASAFMMLVGTGLLLTNRATEGAVATASGLVSGLSILQLSKEATDRRQEANERLDKLIATLDLTIH